MSARHLAMALCCATCAAAGLAVLRPGSPPSRSVEPPAPAQAAPFTDDALGVVADVAADARGRRYILDVQRRQVVVTSPSGGPPATIGRPGSGPGEFRAPVSLALDREGRLLVLDPGTLRIEIFRVADTEARRVGALPLAFPAEDLAACGDRLFLLGSWRFHLIHEISPVDGRILRSLAPDSVPSDDLMAGYRSGGYLECGPGPALTFLPMLRPELTRVSLTTGAQIGRLEIPGYQAVRVERTADGGVRFRAPATGDHDRASAVVTLADGRQLVQVGVLERGARTGHEFRDVRSFIVSWEARTVHPVPTKLPRILRAAADSVFIVETEPGPRVSVARLELGEREGQP